MFETPHSGPPAASTRPSTNGQLTPSAQGPIAPSRQASGGEHAHLPDLPKVPLWGILAIVLTLTVLVVAGFAAGWIPHTRRLEAARTDATEATSAKPTVEVLTPRQAPTEDEVLLPADAAPNQSTAIFARTTGYLRPLPSGVDIGARVSEGQLIAEIATPEVDAQLEQERASLEQARAAAKRAEEEHALAASTLKRYEDPQLGKAVSQQEVDQRRSQEGVAAAAVAEARSTIAVAEANVKRLTELQGFSRVTAPFAGVITGRGYDAGALVSSGDAASGRSLFTLQDTSVLRVAVNVPQAYATTIMPGQAAALLVSNFPTRQFPGIVARTAGAIDPTTRTLRVQVDVPNPEGTLLPGMYGRMKFKVKRDHPALIVPTSAVLSGPEGVRVAVVEKDIVHFRAITLGRDFGAEVEVESGLAAQDQVIKNPGALAEGAEVVRKAAADPARR